MEPHGDPLSTFLFANLNAGTKVMDYHVLMRMEPMRKLFPLSTSFSQICHFNILSWIQSHLKGLQKSLSLSSALGQPRERHEENRVKNTNK
jgi:hypothetical protein